MIPEEDWTKGQRGFVGTTFPTPKGGVLTVVGVSDERVCGKVKFICECSICSQDTELWEEGRMKSLRGTLVRGSVPCGCSNPKWSEDQMYILVRRECTERGYIFNGIYGNYKGNNTNIILTNPQTDNTWSTTTMGSFFRGTGDPTTSPSRIGRKNTVKDSKHIEDFMKSGAFLEGTTFKRNVERKNSKGYSVYWDVNCPKCSNDEYVKAGLCTGEFSSLVSTLKSGSPPCRCSKRYLWTQRQREYQIDKICKEEGLIFVGWETKEGYVTNNSRFKWICNKGHKCCTNVNEFIMKGNRCNTCRLLINPVNGYFVDRLKELDYLYIIKFGSEYIKVGRSFNVEKRISRSSNCLVKESGFSRDEIEILKVYTATHQKVYTTEQWIHEELESRGFTHEDSTWSTETFEVGCEDMIYSLLSSTGLKEVDFT